MTALKLRANSQTPLTSQDHDDNMLRLFGFATLAAMLADEVRGYSFYAAGATVTTLAEGFRYQVAASGATDHHLVTKAGLKLYVLPGDDGTFNVLAFNAAGNDATDDHAVFDRAIKVATGKVLRVPRRTYFLSKTLEFNRRVSVIGEPGTRLRWPAGTHGVIIHILWSTGHTAINARTATAASLLTYQAGLVKYGGNVYSAGLNHSSATLGATTPGTNSAVWVPLRTAGGRDGPVPTWAGPGTYSVINSNPSSPDNHHFRVGTYVLCETDGFYYRVASPSASNHDAVTMFDVKLYIVNPADYPSYTNAAGTLLDTLTLDGTEASGATADGLWLRVAATVRNLTIENFSRDGARVRAAVFGEAPTSPEIWGNANLFQFENLVTRYNGGHGFYAAGSDANAGTVLSGESYGNGRCGYYDWSFLGNTFVGVRTYGNGIGTSAGNSARRSSVVSHGGNRYRAKFATAEPGQEMSTGQTALLVSTTPGTNAAVWELLGAGGPSDEFPAWQSGQSAGFYFFGAGIYSGNNNARTTWMGCSTGDDEAGDVFNGSLVLTLGGYMPRIALGGQVTAENGGRLKSGGMRMKNGTSTLTLGIDPATLISIEETGEGANWRLGLTNDRKDMRFDYAYSDSRVAFLITGENTAMNFGTSMPIPHMLTFPRGFALGQGSFGRIHRLESAAPTTGAHARGEIVWNRDPSAGGTLGWICVTAGTPGAWKTFGSIAS